MTNDLVEAMAVAVETVHMWKKETAVDVDAAGNTYSVAWIVATGDERLSFEDEFEAHRVFRRKKMEAVLAMFKSKGLKVVGMDPSQDIVNAASKFNQLSATKHWQAMWDAAPSVPGKK